MATVEEREENLFKATDAMAQFYDEIESFFDILYSDMEHAGYSAKTWRLRSGTFTIKNLTRRLLASIIVMYFKGVEETEADEEDIAEEEEEEEEETVDTRATIEIAESLRIPFATVWLFPPKTIPSVRTLQSPQLFVGAFGKFKFHEKRTRQPVSLENPELALSNLAQFSIKPNSAVGKPVSVKCWRPKEMKKYVLNGEIVAFEKLRLLEIDSLERIKSIADKLIQFGKA